VKLRLEIKNEQGETVRWVEVLADEQSLNVPFAAYSECYLRPAMSALLQKEWK
jgi:hypothetical protein